MCTSLVVRSARFRAWLREAEQCEQQQLYLLPAVGCLHARIAERRGHMGRPADLLSTQPSAPAARSSSAESASAVPLMGAASPVGEPSSTPPALVGAAGSPPSALPLRGCNSICKPAGILPPPRSFAAVACVRASTAGTCAWSAPENALLDMVSAGWACVALRDTHKVVSMAACSYT